MKRTILTVTITFVMALLLFGGQRAPVQATESRQSANPRSDLVTFLRQDVAAFNGAMDSFVAHRAEYVARNISPFVIGDMTGSNSSTSFTAADVNQSVVDFNTIVNAVRNGGTISVGVWGNVIKIK